MLDTKQINEAVSPESIVNFLCSRLSTTSERQGKQWEIKSQGGLFVDDSGRIAKPAEGKSAGSFGIIGAVIYTETGKFTASGETFKRCLSIAAQEAGIQQEPIPQIKKKPKEKPPIDFNRPTTIYSYTDENGQELFQNCRFEWMDKNGEKQKTFRQRHKKDDKWIWNLNGQRRVPYKLQLLMEEPDLFFDCEGEKDAENLIKCGFVATNIGKEVDEWQNFKHLGKDKLVIVCEDNDKAGKDYARQRAAFWYSAGANVKVLSFPDMPEHSDISDWIQEGNYPEKLPEIINSIPLFSPISDITINFNHQPKEREPLIKIDGRIFLDSGNISGIISGIGKGKSHIIEMFAALAIRPDCEPYAKTEINLKKNERVVIVDTERTQDDCFWGLKRIFRRLEHDKSLLTPDHSELKQLTFTTMTDISSIADRRARLLQIFEMPSLKMLFIDGLLDFVGNSNDVEQSTELITWLQAMSIRHDKGVLYTIHGNRNDDTGKGKGWTGDVAQRKSASFLMLKEHDKFPKIRVLTSNFNNRKVRHGDDHDINIAMTWNEELMAFSFIPYDAEECLSDDDTFISCFLKAGKNQMSHKELCHWYTELTGTSKRTATRHIKQALDVVIEKSFMSSQFYQLRASK